MESFRCYDNSDVIATLMVAVFPNVCLWRRSLCSDLVLTLKNCIEPPWYARTAYVVAIWPSFLFDSFVIIWATCKMFLGKWFTAPPGKNFPYAYASDCICDDAVNIHMFFLCLSVFGLTCFTRVFAYACVRVDAVYTCFAWFVMSLSWRCSPARVFAQCVFGVRFLTVFSAWHEL